MRRHTSQNSSRLEILASERDPATSEALSAADYGGVLRVLQRFYNIILMDCGTGLVHSAMGVCWLKPTWSSSLRRQQSTLPAAHWRPSIGLSGRTYSHLVPGAAVVFSASRQGALGLDMNKLARHFLPSVRALHVIPFDDHLAQGSAVELDKLSRQTRQAFL
jgi:MinD-like ATPase involved in chromosome partitioning or flagellar assembly